MKLKIQNLNKFAVLFLTVALFSCNSTKKETENEHKLLLPVIGEKKHAGLDGTDTIYHTVGDFKFINQNRDTVTQKTIENKIYVADFFFATCQSICPQMSNSLIRVQENFKADKDFLILSHSVNPAHDTSEVLFAYAGKYQAVKDKWHFLTGDKKAIYALAKDSYLVNALEDDGSPEGFLHSELFLLIDKQKRIRGMYDGTDSIAVNKLIEDIKLLKTEK
ncbi:MAG: SCO family protein [Bacteroidia bacterium]|nr:SCO family protein [Bacteroidia bacterium]